MTFNMSLGMLNRTISMPYRTACTCDLFLSMLCIYCHFVFILVMFLMLTLCVSWRQVTLCLLKWPVLLRSVFYCRWYTVPQDMCISRTRAYSFFVSVSVIIWHQSCEWCWESQSEICCWCGEQFLSNARVSVSATRWQRWRPVSVVVCQSACLVTWWCVGYFIYVIDILVVIALYCVLYIWQIYTLESSFTNWWL